MRLGFGKNSGNVMLQCYIAHCNTDRSSYARWLCIIT